MTTCFIEGASEGGEGQEIWVQNVGRTGIKTSERTGGWGEANGAKPRWMSPIQSAGKKGLDKKTHRRQVAPRTQHIGEIVSNHDIDNRQTDDEKDDGHQNGLSHVLECLCDESLALRQLRKHRRRRLLAGSRWLERALGSHHGCEICRRRKRLSNHMCRSGCGIHC